MREAIRDATYVHFACHWVFDSQAPLDAGLELAPENDAVSDEQPARLTLGEIIQNVRLSRDTIVVLSAWETGLTKVEAKHEEYLPAGFLYAGARTVISTLWPVADIETWLLMRSFVRELAHGTDTAGAPRSAQQERRNLSREAALQEIAQFAARESDDARRQRLVEVGQQCSQGDFPFANPILLGRIYCKRH